MKDILYNTLYINTAGRKIEFAYNKKGDFIILKQLDEGKNADDLVYEIKREFDEQGFCFQDIDYTALLNGPGSYTGLRIGSAIAKAICFATGAELIEINTLDMIAEKHFMNGGKGKVSALVFSGMKTGEFFYAEYEDGERISGYGSALPESFTGGLFLLNEEKSFEFPGGAETINLSGGTNINAMHLIALKKISKGETSDYMTSEPFYMKQFPLKSS